MLSFVLGAFGLSTLWLLPLLWRFAASLIRRRPPPTTGQGAIRFWTGFLLVLFASLVSLGRRFRVGIDVDQPDELVTTGIFAISRNPIYVGFALVLVGQFLVFPNWVPLVYLAAGFVLFHRQVLREESFMRQHYSEEYAEYCRRVRRYL